MNAEIANKEEHQERSNLRLSARLLIIHEGVVNSAHVCSRTAVKSPVSLIKDGSTSVIPAPIRVANPLSGSRCHVTQVTGDAISSDSLSEGSHPIDCRSIAAP